MARTSKPKSISNVAKAVSKPADWMSGGTKVGDTYNAWDTYGQGKPDFGVGAGPGEPYRQVQKKVPRPKPAIKAQLPNYKDIISGAGNSTLPFNPPGTRSDPRTDAIRRRLRGL